jgi:serine/threonine protein phosphatase PrpC
MTAYDTAARSHVGLVRKLNEDAILSRPDIALWAVADGMGGHAKGDFASAAVMEALAGVDPGLDAERIAQKARAALIAANEALVAHGQSLSPPKTVGATVVALALDGRRFACVWAGDSRAYRLRDGALAQLTRDHTLVQQLSDRGLIDPSEAGDHPDGHVVTRAIGASARIEVDSVHGTLADGDVFLLCSDGLSRQLDAGELLEGLQTKDLEPAADGLLRSALDRGAPDNVSFIIVRFRA